MNQLKPKVVSLTASSSLSSSKSTSEYRPATSSFLGIMKYPPCTKKPLSMMTPEPTESILLARISSNLRQYASALVEKPLYLRPYSATTLVLFTSLSVTPVPTGASRSMVVLSNFSLSAAPSYAIAAERWAIGFSEKLISLSTSPIPFPYAPNGFQVALAIKRFSLLPFELWFLALPLNTPV